VYFTREELGALLLQVLPAEKKLGLLAFAFAKGRLEPDPQGFVDWLVACLATNVTHPADCLQTRAGCSDFNKVAWDG
jgi:hypothetical protein